jgi:hypothetical protein
MKRSEMLKVITDELFYGSLAARVDKSNTTVTELAEKDAEAVLKLIEKLGMLPPQTSKPIHHYNQDALQCLTEAYHKWEREDEEK